ncbi:YicC/YloC family endoribonuclease [Symbiobacterium thermophilum]|uniref:YicC/YloC family endoribonuclease n=1 Tax=Symbiobacterium thermophilum TaxID=2734 RepID=UPI0035C6978E
MARSMTGFGRGEASGEAGRVTVEVKAVNHRFSEVVFRMPRQFSALEDRVRRLIQGRTARGRFEVYVAWEPSAEARAVKVDKDLALAYYNALRQLAEEIGSNQELSLDTLARLPEVLSVQEGELSDDEIWALLEPALTQAMAGLIAMREREGAALAADLAGRLDRLEAFRAAAAARAPQVVEEYRQRLTRRLEELLPPTNPVDPQRLAQEVALFADRADITEELQRLASHIDQFRRALETDDAVGRKLDFLVQEMGREVNTIGSKANDADLAAAVVAVKSELEKIREQVQNLE